MPIVTCQNCGAETDVIKHEGQKCAYCGTLLQFPIIKQPSGSIENKPSSGRLIPIENHLSGYKGVEYALKNFLTNQEGVPLDIFDNLKIVKINRLYLPMIRYRGSVETEWHTSNRGIYKTGTGKGFFDVLISCDLDTELSEGLDECYSSIEFLKIDSSYSIEWTDTNKKDYNGGVVISDFEDILGEKYELNFEMRQAAERCSFNRCSLEESLKGKFSFKSNLESPLGNLYYIPFVQVLYLYKGVKYEWSFLQDPSIRMGAPSVPKGEEDEMKKMQSLFIKKRKKVWKMETWNFALACFITTPIGALVYGLITDSLYTKAKERLNTQLGLAGLLFVLKRKGNVMSDESDEREESDEYDEQDEFAQYDKYGTYWENPIWACIQYFKDEYLHSSEYRKAYSKEDPVPFYKWDDSKDDLLYDYLDNPPKTIQGIEEYFAKTERMINKISIVTICFWICFPIIELLGCLMIYNS